MKLNNKGFAITSIIYSMLILFLTLVVLIIGNLASRKTVFDKQKSDILDKFEQENLFLNEYEPLEYIESSGTQYIDTNILASENNSFEVKAQLNHTNTASQTVWGGRNSSTAGELQGNQLSFVKSTSTYQFISGNTNVASKAWDTEAHIFYANKNELYIDNNLIYTVDSEPITTNNNVYLFATNTAGSVGFNGGSLKLYYCKIWTGDTLVRDFIPVYKKSEEKAGLYDLVEKMFYADNAGGDFNFVTSD